VLIAIYAAVPNDFLRQCRECVDIPETQDEYFENLRTLEPDSFCSS